MAKCIRCTTYQSIQIPYQIRYGVEHLGTVKEPLGPDVPMWIVIQDKTRRIS